MLGSGGQRLQEWGYVALSRAREETRLYVTGEPRERESHFHDLDDRDHVTVLAQALEESAIERLAVDQRPLPTGPRHETRAEIDRPTERDRTRHRLIEQQRLVLAKTRSRAQSRLTEAERELASLGPLGRRRRAAQLRTEIAFQERALQMADEKLIELDRAYANASLFPVSPKIVSTGGPAKESNLRTGRRTPRAGALAHRYTSHHSPSRYRTTLAKCDSKSSAAWVWIGTTRPAAS